jgi:hypothetical protein
MGLPARSGTTGAGIGATDALRPLVDRPGAESTFAGFHDVDLESELTSDSRPPRGTAYRPQRSTGFSKNKQSGRNDGAMYSMSFGDTPHA